MLHKRLGVHGGVLGGVFHACSECENQYNALYEVTGCCSCTNDRTVFAGDVMSTCAGKRTEARCTSEETRQELNDIICNIVAPADSLGCKGAALGP